MSEASTTWPTNFLTGPRPKLTKDKSDLTSCKCSFLDVTPLRPRRDSIMPCWANVVRQLCTLCFSCNDYTNKDSGKVFKMVPYPEDTATCTCNYNKPSNVRCKWSKIKKSIVRCVRADRPKGNYTVHFDPKPSTLTLDRLLSPTTQVYFFIKRTKNNLLGQNDDYYYPDMYEYDLYDY